MARNNYTPVSFWLSLTLAQFSAWIKDSNAINPKVQVN